MIYVYAVTGDGDPAPPAVGGLDDAPLASCRIRGLRGVFSRHDALSLASRPEVLWRHEAVVESLMAGGPTLPMRFGTQLPDDEALRAALVDKRDSLLALLEDVRGCVELSVRAAWDAPDAERPDGGPDHDGRAYLLSKLAMRRDAEALADQLHEPLAAIATKSRAAVAESPSQLLTASYLVRTEETGRFSRLVEHLRDARPELAIVCTGPWPPYSFVQPGRQ